MTENEALKQLQVGYLGDTEDLVQAKHIAIKALEEIQQYRAIGTVEQLEWCKDASHWKELFKEKLEQYEAIGTVEDIQMIFQLCKDLQVMCGKYHEIGTVDEFKAYKQGNCTNNCKHYDSAIEYVRNKAIDEFTHQLKENLNQEFPRNYESTRPYFSLENARLIVDDVAEQMKAGGIDG